ncbi:hypothetical protein MCP1_20045 [Candidatus Terasakiella magnetica]|nr:hypothetical protein MCP1_20045 [Candidatus Terasakiella magnetica]
MAGFPQAVGHAILADGYRIGVWKQNGEREDEGGIGGGGTDGRPGVARAGSVSAKN